jgi:hypothetical protein
VFSSTLTILNQKGIHEALPNVDHAIIEHHIIGHDKHHRLEIAFKLNGKRISHTQFNTKYWVVQGPSIKRGEGGEVITK